MICKKVIKRFYKMLLIPTTLLLMANAAYAAPGITSPTPSSTLSGSTVTFNWTAGGISVDEWWLYIGTTAGGLNIHDSGSLGLNTTITVSGLPTDGSTVHVRLWYRQGTSWPSVDFQYTAYSSGGGGTPEITTPTPGSTLSGSSDTFNWTAGGTSVDEWWLYIGTTAGGLDIYDSGSLGLNTSTTVSGLPTDGSTVHVRLWYRQGTSWPSVDFQYTAYSSGGGGTPEITIPTTGSTLSGSSDTFNWTAGGTSVDEWWLYIGTTAGGLDIYDSGSLGLNTTTTVSGLPTDGSTVHVRLWYRQGTSWPSVDFQYTAYSSGVCGDGVTDPGEACDDAGESAACNADCTASVCGDGVLNTTDGEECDDSNNIDDDGCQANCQLPVCGDGITDAGEECDDSNNVDGDGCQGNCLLPVCGDGITDAGEDCDDGAESAACNADCTASVCGDGVLNTTDGEECDDSNNVDGDGCQANCQLPVCGDGITDAGEDCDDGAESAACNADCTASVCGDGVLNTTDGEECDDSNNIDDDGCQANCQLPVCGDGITDAGEECDDSNNVDGDGCQGNCLLPVCGDGITDAGEDCDDGAESAACNADCTASVCGDGVLNTTDGEECDDSNNVDGDGCQANCQLPVCGDGITDAGEDCDDGAESAACNADCTASVCGDGVLNTTDGEECDDSNNIDDDGCQSNCQLTEEHIYIMLLHFGSGDKPELIYTLQDIGAQQVDDNTWEYTNPVSEKKYVIHNAQDFETMKQCLYGQNHCIFKGHSNYGIGGVFIPDYANKRQVLDNILYIDDDLIFNYSAPMVSLKIPSLARPGKWTYWWPIDRYGNSGIMPYDFGDPRGDPPYNYYIAYQIPGDSTYYKAETVRNSAFVRFPDSGVEPWDFNDGPAPDSTNPDHLKYFITNPTLDYDWGSTVCGPSGNLECPQPHFGKKTIVFPRELDIDIDELKYKRILLDMCTTCSYYLTTFQRGLTFCTVKSSNTTGTYLYLKAYLEGKSDQEIWEIIQDHNNVYDYFDFNKRPFEQ